MDDEPVDIQKEIDSLLTMLKTPVDRSTLEKELNMYLYKCLMDVESSKRAIIKDHGGSDEDYVPPAAEYSSIANLSDGLTRTLIAKVHDHRVFERNNGKVVQKLGVYDDTGYILINVWDANKVTDCEKIYTFKNCKIVYDNYDKCLTAKCNVDNISPNCEAQIGSYGNVVKGLAIAPDRIVDNLKNVVIYGCATKIWPPSNNPKAPKISGNFKIGETEYRFATWADIELEVGKPVCIDKVSVSFSNYSNQLELKFSNSSFVYEVD